MKQIKLAVFDLEGTIFKNSYGGKAFPSLWAVLCNLCGPEAVAEDNANRDRFYSGGYPGYSSWVIDTLKIHQKYGLKRNQFETLINAVEYYPGVAQTLTALREQGMTIAVISGGLKALADRVAVDHKIEHCFAAAEYFWNHDETICHWNVVPTDFAHKRSVLEILCRDLGITAEGCLYVGDGRNDRDVAGYCGLSIGFNPHEELRSDVDIIIEQPEGEENLSAVLQPIAKYPNFSLDDFSDYRLWMITDSKLTKERSAGTLTASDRRNDFHAFMTRNGLTLNSADSYCSYLNNLCRNIAEVGWEGASSLNAFTVLESVASITFTESTFITKLTQPLIGPHGRVNDSTSAAKQFHRFIKGMIL